ncbi:hypothetical protein HanIR_Chr15g0757261 [Helianthus annuus]|nr:hypothetical protein HanIR_Chr15g0757261 [Helianthus annuus]
MVLVILILITLMRYLSFLILHKHILYVCIYILKINIHWLIIAKPWFYFSEEERLATLAYILGSYFNIYDVHNYHLLDIFLYYI